MITHKRYNHLSLFYAHSAPIFKLHQLLQFSFSLTKCMYLQNSTHQPMIHCLLQVQIFKLTRLDFVMITKSWRQYLLDYCQKVIIQILLLLLEIRYSQMSPRPKYREIIRR